MSCEGFVARNIFVNNEGELRAGWRALAFVFVFVISSITVSGIVAVAGMLLLKTSNPLPQPGPSEVTSGAGIAYSILTPSLSLLSTLIATAICAKLLERRSLASVGFKLHSGWSRDFALGLALGAATIGMAVAIAAGAGAVHFSIQLHEPSMIAYGFSFLFIIFLISAAFEELLFRGFIFQAVAQGVGPVGAVVITSTLFGLAHISNPGATLFSTINTIAAGLWLGVAYLVTRSLWLATALHQSWNFVTVFVFGLPVSGIMLYDQLAWLKGAPGSPTWLSGGGYGPEGGVPAIIAVLLSTLFIWKSGVFKASQDMLAALKKREVTSGLASIIPNTPDSDLNPPCADSAEKSKP